MIGVDEIMNEKDIAKVVGQVVEKYLKDHSNLRSLFDEDSKPNQNTLFFINNFETINDIMSRLFHESELTKYNYNYFYYQYMVFIKLEYDQIIENIENTEKKTQLKLTKRRMIIATMIYLLTSNDFSINDLPIDKTDFVNNDGRHWYRGQSDYEWHLTPSMFRNLSNVFTKDTSIDIKTIEQIYSNNGILKKWEDVFKEKKIDYRFLSYMQHSISYSPLLDFTADFPTAVSFSLSNRGAVNDFAYKDSSVFEIEVEKNQMINAEKDALPTSFSIDYIPHEYVIGTSVLGKPMRTYDDIITALTPYFVMIDTESNDRMRYQRGKFIFFYDYLSIKGTVCTWLNKDLKVTKYRIKREEKNKWCEFLREKYPYLSVEKMMNPYNYFSDQFSI